MKKLLLFFVLILCLGSFAYSTTLNDTITHAYNFTNLVDSITGTTASNNGASSNGNGIRGGSYSFPANADITLPFSLNPEATRNFTVNVWMNASTIHAGVLVGDYNEGAVLGWYLNYGGDGVMRMRHKCGGTTDLSTAQYIEPLQWYMITAIWGLDGWTLYVNGTLKASNSGLTCGNNAVNVVMGQRDPNNDHFNGLLDETTFWNRSLNPTEITELYNAGAGTFYPFTPPVVFPVFEDPTPADAATNDTQVNINVSCSAGNVTLWFDDIIVLDQQISPADYTTSVTSVGTYDYLASCDVGITNSSTRTWTYNANIQGNTIDQLGTSLGNIIVWLKKLVSGNYTKTTSTATGNYSIVTNENYNLLIAYDPLNTSLKPAAELVDYR